MKIALICRLRTRSTFLLENLCAHYKIQNLNEGYFDIDSKYLGAMYYSKKLKNTKARDTNWNLYQSEFQSMTNANFETEFGIKIFTKMLYSKPLTLYESDYDDIKIMTDLTTFANIRKYDQIYYLSRELFSSVFSQIYSLEIKNAIYRKNTAHLVKRKLLKITDIYFPYIDSYILDVVLQEKILDFLVRENILHTKLDYVEIPSYVNAQLNGFVNNPTVDTEFNYDSLIENTIEIKDYISKTYEKISDRFRDITFI